MTNNKLFIDSINLNNYEIIQLQAEKIKVADLLQAYEDIEAPSIYHKLAYRYRLDEIMDTLAVYYEIVADLAHKTSELSQSFNQVNLPPYIQIRINAIMSEQEEKDPNMSETKRGVIFDALFALGGEFDGLFISNDKSEFAIDNDWLENYITKSEQDGRPVQIKIEFTEDILKDIESIEEDDISNAEKEERIALLFSKDGKHNNALQMAYEKELEQYSHNE